MTSEAAALEEGMARLGLSGPPGAVDRLIRYLDLLEKWNRSYNLTSVRDRTAWVSVHLLDSLAVAPDVVGPRVLDVGTGAGLPGIPLAVLQPDADIQMIDSVQKKTAFVAQVIAELGLRNAHVHHGRVEELVLDPPADTVVSRAFAETAKFVALVHHLVRPGGRLVTMKGVHPAEELDSLPAGVDVTAVHPVEVPGLAASRHVVVLRLRDPLPGDKS